jgi:sigma-E factor negative regulatory protein RseC
MEYEGVIIAINPDVMFVRINLQSACNQCHAQKTCGITGTNEKVIEIPCMSGNYHTGETVTVIGKTSMGLKAVWYAFVAPVSAGLAVLITAVQFHLSDLNAALAALITVASYYMVIYCLRDKLKRKFTFTIKQHTITV